MLFFKKKKDLCSFCGHVLDGYGWRERGKLYCNEFCAEDEETFNPHPPRMTLDQLSLELSRPLLKENCHDP